jgi:hypothetical protein
VQGPADSPTTPPITLHAAYKTISGLNELLRQERPNVLIVPARWPETYSYTLTLAMLTKLPVIVLRNSETFDDCPVIRRSKLYPLAHFHDFQSLPSVVKLAESIRGTEFHLVKPQVHVPPQWRQLLAPQLPNVFLVASKIVTSATPLSYWPFRSRFTPQQRFQHSLETIASIRLRVPASFVVFIDNSDFQSARAAAGDDTDWAAAIAVQADVFINDWTNKSLAYYTDVSDHKALGEAMLLEQGMQRLEEMDVMPAGVFKLTARYVLNANFSMSRFANPYNIFKRPAVGPAHDLKPTYLYTCFYKIAAVHLEKFRDSLRSTISTLQYMTDHKIPTGIYDDIESRLAASLPEVHLVETLGVSQRVSVYAVPDEFI